jgi:hypothetical protein
MRISSCTCEGQECEAVICRIKNTVCQKEMSYDDKALIAGRTFQ